MIFRAALFLCTIELLAAQESATFSRDVDAAVELAIHQDLIPGAVLLVGHGDRIVYHKAYGSRSIAPAREAMTEDTIFDIASLTKVVATTPCLMRLVEQGKLRLAARVTDYLPEFQGGKTGVTIRDLLTHFSGLRPDLDIEPTWNGYETGVRKALAEKSVNPPGTHFRYSDINFMLLGEIVHRLSGKMLDEFASETVFEPLGMKDTMFRPPDSLGPRIAPTEIDPASGHPFRGMVHDETSRAMGGVAGHAGVFSTAADLARYAQMMLSKGVSSGTRLFSAETIRKFTSPQSPADQPILRGLGWDIDSPYSSNRGELFPIGSYGHTGFTGTDIWIDPASRTYLILLTNAVHPHRGKSLTTLRSAVATIVAASYGYTVPTVNLTGYNETIEGPGPRRTVARNGQVRNGLDVMARGNFALLRGHRLALITNHTGLSRDGKRNIDLMRDAGIDIHAILSPEHGFAVEEDRPDIGNSRDPSTGIPVYSLYQGKTRRPNDEMLRGVDTMVFDIQDVGARFYTYSCTMIYSMEEAARRHLPFYVLDRPNPITGVHVEGPVLDHDLESFTGCAPVPIRHGMTLGEIARMVNGVEHLNADLRVVKMEGWERGDWFDSTGLTWIDPSPNMRSLNAALLYPGLAMIEASGNYSVGRGTDAPFEQIGATWIHGEELAAALNGSFIPGVRAYPTRFRPADSHGKNEWMEGVRFTITDRESFNSIRLGMEVAFGLKALYPGKLNWEENRWLIGNRQALLSLEGPGGARDAIDAMDAALDAFLEKRQKYLLY